ncbi:AmmeMemoRadiSam system radical SAM enzyme [Carboxylicivirga linearis]|uniref:AmmeMemoRadiSam system radical SAM enzyme n=1 Tax=Carboxylicivirga linearis TaxID=1628157 RepID=A0ABS5JT22_9BACT|nr:AmmeMemoRadiSam system radical SAM enzyme [Carboxylicivirga linearis]MBS2098058.1 AmmeMemoRadiSam system radical SAM enzyme [Carboxylicivirga linearis]
MKEAEYYVSRNKEVTCLLCPHACTLSNGQRGKCQVRRNVEGKLISESYGNVSALHVDPIEKKPLYHFHPGSKSFSISTNGCVLSCLNCQNWQISQRGIDIKPDEYLHPEGVVKMAVDTDCKSIAYTYTDPVVFYEYMIDMARVAQTHGLKNVLISSGYLNTKPLKELIPFIDAANIDLKCFDDQLYRKLNGATLKPVLQALKNLKQSNVWLEITNLIIPGWTDDMEMIRKMCSWLASEGFNDVPLHFNRFTPAYKLNSLHITPESTLQEAKMIAKENGLKYVYIGNVYGHDYTSTFCFKCGELLIKRFKGVSLIGLSENGVCVNCNETIVGVWNE